MLTIAACINGENAIFGRYYKEALCSPLLHASMARPRFSVFIKATSHLTIFMRGMCAKGKIQRNDYQDKQRRSPFVGKTSLVALCSPLLHESAPSLRFSGYVINKPLARHR